MGLVRKLFLAVLPERGRAAVEADSRRWEFACPCGHRWNLWEAGGVRYRASGPRATLGRCPSCGRWRMLTLRRIEDR